MRTPATETDFLADLARVFADFQGREKELQGKVPNEKRGDTKLPDPGFVDAIRARVYDKIREVKGKAGAKEWGAPPEAKPRGPRRPIRSPYPRRCSNRTPARRETEGSDRNRGQRRSGAEEHPAP